MYEYSLLFAAMDAVGLMALKSDVPVVRVVRNSASGDASVTVIGTAVGRQNP